MAELVRTPARYPEGRKYDYATPDGRWFVRWACCYGGGWDVIDTTGEIYCENHAGHAATVKTLDAAKALITEWSTNGPIGVGYLGEFVDDAPDS